MPVDQLGDGRKEQTAETSGADRLRRLINGSEPIESTARCSIIIERARNGWIVKVGCETLVSQSWKEINEGLELYWKDPKAAQKKFCQ